MRTLLRLPVLLCAAGAVSAQQPRDSSINNRLPIVTVTATRTATALASAPFAISQIGVDRLRSVAGVGLTDALQGVPGVLAQSRAGGVDTRITIRGFGSRGAGDRSNAATMRGIRVMIDGIPETEPDGRTSLDLIDLAAVSGVDVIRSNASALWGNAAGGILSLSSTPLSGVPFELRTMTGSFGLRRAVISTGSGSGDSRLYATVSRTESDGWRANSASERTLFSTGMVTPLGDRTRLAVRLIAAQNNFDIPGPLTEALALTQPRSANATYLTRRERRGNQVVRAGATLETVIGTAGVLSVMSYLTPKKLIRSERNTYREFNRVHGGGGVNLRNTFGAHSVIVGADIQHQDGPARFFALTAAGEKGTSTLQDKNERATTGGMFVQDEWAATSRVSLNLGARLDAIRYGLTDRVTPKISGSRQFSQVSPKFGASFRASTNQVLYANLSAGLEAPANNETDPAGTFGQDTVVGINPLLKPIRSLTYEVGTRQRLTGTRPGVKSLSYELALFNTEVRDELVPYRGGRFYFNAARARRQGAELAGEVQFEHGIAIRSTATLMQTEYLNYTVDSVHYGKSGRLANYSGNALVGVPKSMGSAGIRWDVAHSPVRLDGEFQYTGRYMLNDANTVELPDASVFNLSLALRRPARLIGRMALTGFVRVENLLDRRYITSGFLNPDVVAGQAVAYEPGMPRAFTVSLGLVRLR